MSVYSCAQEVMAVLQTIGFSGKYKRKNIYFLSFVIYNIRHYIKPCFVAQIKIKNKIKIELSPYSRNIGRHARYNAAGLGQQRWR